MWLNLIMILIFFASMAMLYSEGMWSNAIRLINTVTAALLAVNFFEPATVWFNSTITSSYAAATDFVALWVLFVLFSLIFRAATDSISRVKVRFLKQVDQIGGGILAAWTGWVLVCFALMTFHTAPLGKNFLDGTFQPQERMLVFAPDRLWLGFVQQSSRGAFCNPGTDEEIQRGMFDPNAEYLMKYATRRGKLELHVKKSGSTSDFDDTL